ncbi:DUF4145 domain-containing protein [Sphingorhabdus contaminans]|uniref:DUF4145 domain-containing protein n=1 Tax=Sphingorhabdus contaminans TaxID=1343899 RepID=A0A553WIN5_9SPHN|nr:DUF4145 domain-containing protein [Sphingorhabdus contaminans]TSB04565.1 DUF4145 domain-containing protein [Sphingorhabdus contaminans]
MSFSWNCPFCSSTQTVVPDKHTVYDHHIKFEHQAEGLMMSRMSATSCANRSCQRTSFRIQIGGATYTGSSWTFKSGSILFSQQIVPQGTAKPQPSYIPSAIVEDYTEACLIRELSPKAAATLIRRCIQGMIRDFAGISKPRLIDEIKALRKAIDDGSADRSISIESVDAIDAVRSIGNIGAHMERDINEIVEVDPGEAQALIELVEMLFDEWYSAREKRRKRLSSVLNIADDKKATKSGVVVANASVVNAMLGMPQASDSDNDVAGAD